MDSNLACTSFVILGKLLNLSVLQFVTGNNSMHLIGLLGG